jgi:hypothetical protein
MPPDTTAERALGEFIYEDEAVPLLLRGRVLLALAAGGVLIVGASFLVIQLLGVPTSLDAEPLQ